MLALGLCGAAPSCPQPAEDAPRPAPEAYRFEGRPPERQLEFYIGSWSYGFEQGEGNSTVRMVHGGKVLREEVVGVVAGAEFTGTTLGVFDPRAGHWKLTWVDSFANYLSIIGRVEDETFVMRWTMQSPAGDPVELRLTYSDITSADMMTQMHVSNDGGETWRLARRAKYTRTNDG